MFNPFPSVVESFFAEPHGSLLNGILFGTKQSLSSSLYQSLADTGTMHIVALSGMNISILAQLTAQSTLFLGRKASSMLTISLIVLFTFFVGASPTIVRAAIMGSMSLIAVYFGRQSWSLLNLVLASLIMLLVDFTLLKNLSFQLSFLATFGVILANKHIQCQRKFGWREQLISAFKNNFILTLFAQLCTLPVILYTFHRISLVAPLANILIEWAIQPVMVIGLITAVLGWIWWPLGVIPSWFVWVLLSYILSVVRILAKFPLAAIRM